MRQRRQRRTTTGAFIGVMYAVGYFTWFAVRTIIYLCCRVHEELVGKPPREYHNGEKKGTIP